MDESFRGHLKSVLATCGGAFVIVALSHGIASGPVAWWASRVFGFVAYLALWSSMLLGVLVASRGGGGLFVRPWILELHDRWGVTALVFTLVHVIASMADATYGVDPLVVVYPFASTSLKGPLAVGTFALWGLALVTGTTAAFRKLPRVVWRAVHGTAFGCYVLALVHGVTAGSDTGDPRVAWFYLLTAAVLVAAIVQRLLLAADGGRLRA